MCQRPLCPHAVTAAWPPALAPARICTVTLCRGWRQPGACGWVQRAKLWGFARKLQAQSCAGWERDRVQAGTAHPGKTGPTTVIIYRAAREGIQIPAVRSLCTAHCGLLIPRLGPGTAVVQVAVVGTGNRAGFFSLKLVWEQSLVLIMLNICSLGLLHVSNPVMTCEEKKSLIFSKDQLLPL